MLTHVCRAEVVRARARPLSRVCGNMFAVYIARTHDEHAVHGTRTRAHTRTVVERSVPRGFKGIYTQLQASARQEAICGRCNLQELAAESGARLNTHTHARGVLMAASTKFSSITYTHARTHPL